MYKRTRKLSIGAIIIFTLLAIGLIVGLSRNFFQLLLPIIVFGGIFLLYKYPPSFLRKNPSQHYRSNVIQSRTTSDNAKKVRPRSKTVPFRVIDGGKDDNDHPKYH
ncbi:hypothetical protein [Paenibacillus sp. GSMTC-2017]|uniref:hypothetical protein n=1 Tax=Paenibacillus sp. GSMTC-2017 TaxID=2794350 RepID=UPI001E2BA505|nr:hypothetical protein [Paenibacillus sp. GSMTC-2017]